MKSRIRGSLFGVLIGDCNGAIFEESSCLEGGARKLLTTYFNKLELEVPKGPKKAYTDDTAMSIAVAKTLIAQKNIDQNLLARNFVQEYNRNPRRQYGRGTIDVLEKWQKSNFANLLEPARQAFGGKGSLGNGAAMRIAPVSLFFHNVSLVDIIDKAKKSAELTHSNDIAIVGGVLQALAIRLALTSSPPINASEFLDNLDKQLAEVPINDARDIQSYRDKINQIKRLLKTDPSDETVVNVLGNSCLALQSVPTAIYCFLKSFQPIQGLEAKNEFRKAIEFAIRLGGDTDTIASMTGAISGAFHGEPIICRNFVDNCEGYEEISELGDKIYEASANTN